MPQKPLREFFAITKTSLYRVRAKGLVMLKVEAKKIALKGESKVRVGTKLKRGTMLAIGYNLQMYYPEGSREIENINTIHHGGHSSNIVALFLNEKEARGCFEQNNLSPCDQRWLEQTKQVLAAIGDNHPVFYIVKFPRTRLLVEPA